MDEIEFTNLTRKIVDAPYVLGNTSKGYDCLSMLYAVYGDKLPLEWKGWTLKNYAERWRKGGGRKEFIEFLSDLGISVPINFIRKGDIVIFGWTDDSIGPSIYIGNDKVLAVFISDSDFVGGRVIPMHLVKSKILDIRRLQ